MSQPGREVTFTEIYPINREYLPPLYAWWIDAPSGDMVALGRKLAHRLRVHQKGHWHWAQGHLITDARRTPDELLVFLKQLWAADDEVFRLVTKIKPVSQFNLSAQTEADFIAQAIQDDLDTSIQAILREDDRAIANAKVERNYAVQGWVVSDQPSLSITINSEATPTITLSDYIRANSKALNDVVGLKVRDRTSTLRGNITEIRGTLGEQREELLDRASRPQMKEIIEQLPEDDLVLRVNGKYDYPAAALELVVSSGQYTVLQIDGSQALKALQISPKPRSVLVRKIAEACANLGYIHPKPYSSAAHPQHFRQFSSVILGLRAQLGDGATCACDPQEVLKALATHPPYRRSSLLNDGNPLRIAVLNVLGVSAADKGKAYIKAIADSLYKIGFPVKFVGSAERPSLQSSREVGQALDRLEGYQPHIVIAALPNADDSDDDEQRPYFNLKAEMLKRNLQSQMIQAKTLGNDYAIPNVVLGILAKTGTLPYAFDRLLPYTDLLVGIDIGRVRLERKRGSMSMAAITQVYGANGDFLRYRIADTPVEGETLTAAIIHDLFPEKTFAGQRCLVHRDGLFRGDERNWLYQRAAEVGATFYLVEVVKSYVPRLYGYHTDQVVQPAKGSTFVLNDREAIVVSSLPPSRNSTPRPLLIRCFDDELTIENAVHSVLALTQLHYGSVRMPRLPVTLHYSDQIAYLLLRGVRPRSYEGSTLWWL